MSDNKVKHIGALICWAVLHAYYLALHFSKTNLAVYAVAVLYLFLTTVQSEKQEKTHVVDTLSELVGTTFAVFLAYYFFCRILPDFVAVEKTGFLECVKFMATQLKRAISMNLKHEISMFSSLLEKRHFVALIAAAVFFFKRNSSKHPILGIAFKYLWSGTLLMVYIDMHYRSVGILGICMAVTMIFIACDVMKFHQNRSCGKAGKKWYNALSILLFVMLLIRPGVFRPFLEEGYMEYYFITCGLKWYTVLFLLVVLFVTGIVMIIGYDEHNAKTNTDVFVFWDMICILIAVFFMSRFYVGYWWVVAAVYAICVTVAIVALNPVEMDKSYTRMMSTYLFLLIATVAAVITVIAGHYGRLLQTWVIVGGIVVSADQYRRRKKDCRWLIDARFYGVVLLCIALSAAITLWCTNRLVFNFLVLAGIFVCAMAFVWVTSMDSGLFANRSQTAQIAATVLFALLCVSLCSKNGAKIKIAPDDVGTPIVEISTKGDRTVERVEYHWLEDYLQLEDEKKGFSREVMLPGSSVPQRDGRLRVTVTDNYGTQVERIYWVHVKTYTGV